jgi:lipoprotein-releasing system permease protein
LNTEFFVARRLSSLKKGSFSRPIVAVSIASVALGIAIMIVSVAILTGFQMQIREKVSGFNGHIRITRFNENDSFEPTPLSSRQPFLKDIRNIQGVQHIQVFATKPGIIKTKEQIQGVMFKGAGRDFDWDFFKNKLIAGTLPSWSDTLKGAEVLISGSLAKLLSIQKGDEMRMYFVSGNVTLGRKLKVSGMYSTGLEELDKLYVVGDIRQIIKLNGWKEDEVGGFEVFLNDFNDVERIGQEIYRMIGFDLDATTILQQYPQIFDWLSLQDVNVMIILSLMVVVSAITMIATLLILIIERTATIGILKALGMKNRSIRKIFLYNSLKIIGYGLLWGNLTGLTLCLIQQKTGMVTLPEESYYVSVAPIYFDWINILLINAGCMIITFSMLLVPSYIITRINPVSAIRFN